MKASGRPLLRHLAWRDFKLRYRQTALGFLWAVIQPLLPMVIFSAIFARVLRPEIPGIPYSLFVLSGIVPWSFFSSSISTASGSFVNNFALLNKVYFPRGILPAAAVAGCAFDLLLGCLLLLADALVSGITPRWSWLGLAPAMVFLVLLSSFISLGLASLSAMIRDVKHAIPFLIQVAMYATPVIYSAALVPAKWRWAFGLNPMTSVVLLFRACLFGDPLPPSLFVFSLLSAAAAAIAAIVVFERLERNLAERV